MQRGAGTSRAPAELIGRGPTIPAPHLVAFSLVGEVIEFQRQPTLPWGPIHQTALGPPYRKKTGPIEQGTVGQLFQPGLAQSVVPPRVDFRARDAEVVLHQLE